MSKCTVKGCLIEAVIGIPVCTRSDCAYTLRDADGPARVRASVASDVVGIREGEKDQTYRVKRKRADLLIPGRYVSGRVLVLWRARELTAQQVKAASTFVYNEHHAWVSRSVGSNFPRGYKVQSSVRTHDVKIGETVAKPPHYMWLQLLLIEELPFRVVAARFGCTGSRRTLHRKGKELLRQLLEETRRFWAS